VPLVLPLPLLLLHGACDEGDGVEIFEGMRRIGPGISEDADAPSFASFAAKPNGLNVAMLHPAKIGARPRQGVRSASGAANVGEANL
jgi:hypothetical protein